MIPVILFAYNRPKHTELTIQSLMKNKSAENIIFYVFVDGKKENDSTRENEKVKTVVEKYKTSSSFKEFHSIYSNENKGLATSVINGVNFVLYSYDKVIVLEDDLITSNDFYEYMCEALSFYQDDEKIWSISGYTANIKNYNNSDLYFVQRACSWGWATWKDRWETIDWKILYNEEIYDHQFRSKIGEAGLDLLLMIEDQKNRKIDSWAIRWVINQIFQDKWTVYPMKSKVINIGLDNSGTHSGFDKRYVVERTNEDKVVFTDLYVDSRMIRNFRKIFMSRFVYCYHRIRRKLKI